MGNEQNDLKLRKKEHLAICETDAPAFDKKSTGFEKYDFLHYALTDVEIDQISFHTEFFGRKINYPMLISCMTGGVDEADNINLALASVAARLHIPLGLGSLRYALETTAYDASLEKIRQKAGSAPLLGNIGAAQIIRPENSHALKRLVRLIELDAFVIHLNPLQELLQKNGEPHFQGINSAIAEFVEYIGIPVIVKEVGSGISAQVAKELLSIGVQGIDVAGAGGTSWAGVEILRNGSEGGEEFWDWGIPTAHCISTVGRLKDTYDFLLIGSGGVNNAFDAAKALALGAQMFGSARAILQELSAGGAEGVITMIKNWFLTIKNVMFLTGAQTLKEFDERVLIKEKDFC
jgi:isopentenyl-diphosphate delta-isomerase